MRCRGMRGFHVPIMSCEDVETHCRFPLGWENPEGRKAVHKYKLVLSVSILPLKTPFPSLLLGSPTTLLCPVSEGSPGPLGARITYRRLSTVLAGFPVCGPCVESDISLPSFFLLYNGENAPETRVFPPWEAARGF